MDSGDTPVGILKIDGFWVQHSYLSAEESEQLATKINKYATLNEVPKIERPPIGGFQLKRRVIRGDEVRRALPDVWNYQFKLLPLIETLFDERLEPWADERVVVNVNIYGPSDSYELHCDRCPITALLYPMVTGEGGAVEIFTSARSEVRVPRQGTLLVVAGDRIPHAVHPVISGARISIPVAFGLKDQKYKDLSELDRYLYSDQRPEAP